MPYLSVQAAMLATLKLITPVAVINVDKVRVGGSTDGGYVMVNDLEDVGVCYSLGVGPDVSWDLEMAQRGALIYQYDHTVDAPPALHPHFRYFRVGITHDDSLSPNLKRLDTLIAENGHTDRRDMILKIDIEGFEWDSLVALDVTLFSRFKQMVVEFHGLRMLNIDSFRQRAFTLFSKLRKFHEVVHVHGNNFAGMPVVEGIPIADCIELTFANREYYSFGRSIETFPGSLDTPNNSNLPDLFLGSFKF